MLRLLEACHCQRKYHVLCPCYTCLATRMIYQYLQGETPLAHGMQCRDSNSNSRYMHGFQQHPLKNLYSIHLKSFTQVTITSDLNEGHFTQWSQLYHQNQGSTKFSKRRQIRSLLIVLWTWSTFPPKPHRAGHTNGRCLADNGTPGGRAGSSLPQGVGRLVSEQAKRTAPNNARLERCPKSDEVWWVVNSFLLGNIRHKTTTGIGKRDPDADPRNPRCGEPQGKARRRPHDVRLVFRALMLTA